MLNNGTVWGNEVWKRKWEIMIMSPFLRSDLLINYYYQNPKISKPTILIIIIVVNIKKCNFSTSYLKFIYLFLEWRGEIKEIVELTIFH